MGKKVLGEGLNFRRFQRVPEGSRGIYGYGECRGGIRVGEGYNLKHFKTSYKNHIQLILYQFILYV